MGGGGCEGRGCGGTTGFMGPGPPPEETETDGGTRLQPLQLTKNKPVRYTPICLIWMIINPLLNKVYQCLSLHGSG